MKREVERPKKKREGRKVERWKGAGVSRWKCETGREERGTKVDKNDEQRKFGEVV